MRETLTEPSAYPLKRNDMKTSPRPVSEKFYAKLQDRVVKIMRSLGYTGNESTRVMEYLDRYLETGNLPKFRHLQEHLRVAIYSCVPEIDEAIARSAACRRRAAERRERRLQAEKARAERETSERQQSASAALKTIKGKKSIYEKLPTSHTLRGCFITNVKAKVRGSFS